jgi:hypothetical protein
MKDHTIRAAFLSISLLMTVSIAHAGIINFDEYTATNSNVPVTTLYSSLGVTFSATNFGIWSGIANGDPGAWGLNGTNGSDFLADNGGNNGGSYTDYMYFATAQSSVSFDASRSDGSSAGQTLEVNAFDGGSLVATESLALGNINSWTTFDLTGSGITEIELVGSSNGFSPFGIDNLQFSSSTTTTPEPSSFLLLGSGFAALAGIIKRKLTA